MAREEKVARVNEIKDIFEESDGIIFTDHSGLDAENIYNIRNKLYEVNSRIRIIKNTLTILAAKQVYTDIDFSEVLTGPTSIISGDDILAAAKVAKALSKDYETFVIKAGIIAGKLHDQKSIKRIAALPTREVLIGQFIGLLSNPVTRLVMVLSNQSAGLVNVLNLIKGKKEKQSAQK